jgi:5'-3' exonuclease
MKTLIIDGNNLIHRTFWTAKTQSQRTNTDTPDQINNFHIYFTLNAIFSYVSKFIPDKTILVWDEKKEYQVNERKELFSEYKGNRSADSSPHQNNSIIKEVASFLGIPSIFPKQYEADDIVSHICRYTPGEKIIVSVDKDFLQLIDKQITLYDPIRKASFTFDNFEEKTGYRDTKTWLEAKCLLGDKSDNVPGIAKFGKAKVAKYIEGSLQLSEEETIIFQRNYSLFNLTHLTPDHEETNYYKEQLDAPVTADWSSFIQACKERSFHSILKKKESWYNTFFLRNKLMSLFK